MNKVIIAMIPILLIMGCTSAGAKRFCEDMTQEYMDAYYVGDCQIVKCHNESHYFLHKFCGNDDDDSLTNGIILGVVMSQAMSD